MSREALREEFNKEAFRKEQLKQYTKEIAKLESLEDTLITAFNNLVKFLDGKTSKVEIINQLKEISTPDVDKVVKVIEKLDKNIIDNKLDLRPLTESLNTIKRELSLIPKTLPKFEQKDSLKVSNLDEVVLDTTSLEKAIRELNLKVEAPIINTEKVDVKPLQDIMLDLLKAFKSFKVEIPEYPEFPEIPKTDLTNVEKKLDESNKQLKKLVEKPAGGGGGGNSSPYIDSTGKIVNVELVNGKVPVDTGIIAADSTNFAFYGSTSDTTYDYVGKQSANGKWYIMRIHKTTGVATYATGDSDMSTAWTNVGTQTYGDWDTYNQATAEIAATSNSKPFLVDEHSVESQMMSDNYFAGSPVVIDSAHHEIHCGDMVSLNHTVDLGNAGTRDILVIIPDPAIAVKRYHFQIEIDAESEADYKLYEGATVSANGTALNARNRNRMDPAVAENEVLYFHTPAVTGTGTLLADLHWGSGKGVGGSQRSSDEWVLKNNTKYLIRIKNETTTNNYISLRVNYYVHPGI